MLKTLRSAFDAEIRYAANAYARSSRASIAKAVWRRDSEEALAPSRPLESEQMLQCRVRPAPPHSRQEAAALRLRSSWDSFLGSGPCTMPNTSRLQSTCWSSEQWSRLQMR